MQAARTCKLGPDILVKSYTVLKITALLSKLFQLLSQRHRAIVASRENGTQSAFPIVWPLLTRQRVNAPYYAPYRFNFIVLSSGPFRFLSIARNTERKRSHHRTTVLRRRNVNFLLTATVGGPVPSLILTLTFSISATTLCLHTSSWL